MILTNCSALSQPTEGTRSPFTFSISRQVTTRDHDTKMARALPLLLVAGLAAAALGAEPARMGAHRKLYNGGSEAVLVSNVHMYI